MVRILSQEDSSDFLFRIRTQVSEAEEVVKPILDAVHHRGDAALREYAQKFDGFSGTSFTADSGTMCRSLEGIDAELRASLNVALDNICAFARLQMPKEFSIELAPGHRIGQTVRPLQRVAAYVPGGFYPLPSTVLMCVATAKVAGVPDVWVTTPKSNNTILAAAKMAGADSVSFLGGAHAIAAFAFGTDSIPRVDRIVGPGNRFVAAAKKLLAGEVGIDFVAGPTEVAIIASEGNPDWIALDMIAQAEHDPDASAILFTTSSALAIQVQEAISRQIPFVTTQEQAASALANNGAIIVCKSIESAIDLCNSFAPEHLSLNSANHLDLVQNAGSIFLGPWSPEAAGDYCTGPNHVLPTSGVARVRGGLSVHDFMKLITVQELSAEGLSRLAPDAIRLARAEGLDAHARSMEIRIQ